MSDRAQTWAIVGGGMLGMTLALRLAQSGRRVRLIEAAGHLGGVADAWNIDGLTVDRHYHVILLSDTRLRSMLGELDLENEIEWVETKTGFYTDGQLYSMSNSVEFLRFPPLKLLDKLRLGLTIFYASKLKDGKPLEKIPVGDWLRRWSGKRTFEKIWLPLLRAKLGDSHEQVSAAFIWSTIARMYEARRTGLKKEMFGYMPDGYGRIVDRFSARLEEAGVDVQTATPVNRVEGVDGGKVSIEFPDGNREQFDRAVLTVPSPFVTRLCPQLSDDERQRHLGLKYQGVLCASVLLDGPLSEYYVTNITDPAPFTAVIEMTALADPRHFGGRRLVYLPRYAAPDDPIFDLTDDEIEERFLDALEKMYPHFNRGGVSAFKVSRVRSLLPLPTLNYSDSLPPIRTSVEGLFAVNGAQIINGTFNVNETIRLAERTLKNELLPDVSTTLNEEQTDDVEEDGELVARP